MSGKGKPFHSFFQGDLETIQAAQYPHRHKWLTRISEEDANENKARLNNIKPQVIEAACSVCYLQLKFKWSPENTYPVSCKNLSHHFHWNNQEESEGVAMGKNDNRIPLSRTAKCCDCSLRIEVEWINPQISFQTVRQMERARKDRQDTSPYDMLRRMHATISTIVNMTKKAASGNKRPISTTKPAAVERLRFDDGCNLCFELLGFKLIDSSYHPPEDPEIFKSNTKILHELEMIDYSLQLRFPDLQLDIGCEYVPLIDEIAKTIDGNSLPKRPNYRPDKLSQSERNAEHFYSVLGLDLSVNGRAVVWAYEKAVQEDDTGFDKYFDALDGIGDVRKSESINSKVKEEISNGKYTKKMLEAAYNYFGIDNSSVDDSAILGIYNMKCSDEPMSIKVHQRSLRIIGNARNSTWLKESVEQSSAAQGHNTIASSIINETASGNEVHPAVLNASTALQPSQASHKGLPLGLDNIGNTCYLNSLLQYYFSVLPLRELLSKFGDKVTWNEKLETGRKDGTILLKKSDISKSITFIELLSHLFKDLSDNQGGLLKSVRPSYDLAIMALGSDSGAEGTRPKSARIEKAAKAKAKSKTKKSNELLKDALEGSEKTDAETEKQQSDTDQQGGGSTPNTRVRTPVNRRINFMQQQDITECMSACMTYIESALPPVSDKNNGRGKRGKPQDIHDDLFPHNLFFGKLRSHLVSKGGSPDTARKVVGKGQVEPFQHLYITMSDGGGDINECLDRIFEPHEVEISITKDQKKNSTENGSDSMDVEEPETSEKATASNQAPQESEKIMVDKYQTIDRLPSFLQIQVQRVQYDVASSKAYKSNAPLTLHPFLSMARHVTPKQPPVDLTNSEQQQNLGPSESSSSEDTNGYSQLRHNKESKLTMLNSIKNKNGKYVGHPADMTKQVIDSFKEIQRSSLRTQENGSNSESGKSPHIPDLERCQEELSKLHMFIKEQEQKLETDVSSLSNQLRQHYTEALPPEFLETQSLIESRISSLSGENYHHPLANFSFDNPPPLPGGSKGKGLEESEIKWPSFGSCSDETIYTLHAVFIHQGEADWGHYWCYIRDHRNNRWIQFNDANISIVSDIEVYKDTSGSNANTYGVVYVRYKDIPKLTS
ncbi:ubiquitin-specific protease ubp2 [Mycoemilia scoparia]|uniref:ubiquitinyl hydrolase 1 n=1 Tax=Mycoemilia scoparia TaxID=417184 RepID=A0A9W7ZZ52_9FUNG|nr:ubiquitin-specific protease ubp2 [Mycoemilia scoparia]